MIEKLNFAKLHRRGGTLGVGSFAVSTHFGQASKSMIRINNSNVGEREQERGDLLSRKLFPTFAPKSSLARSGPRRHSEQTRESSLELSASVIGRT